MRTRAGVRSSSERWDDNSNTDRLADDIAEFHAIEDRRANGDRFTNGAADPDPDVNCHVRADSDADTIANIDFDIDPDGLLLCHGEPKPVSDVNSDDHGDSERRGKRHGIRYPNTLADRYLNADTSPNRDDDCDGDRRSSDGHYRSVRDNYCDTSNYSKCWNHPNCWFERWDVCIWAERDTPISGTGR